MSFPDLGAPCLNSTIALTAPLYPFLDGVHRLALDAAFAELQGDNAIRQVAA